MEKQQEIVDFAQIIERYLILLLGAVAKPIPTPVHLQKEFFILSKTVPKISEYIVFEKHYKGPYSADLKDISEDPVYYSDCFIHDSYGFHLTLKGKDFYDKILDFNKKDKKFIEFLAVVKMIRNLYDTLSEDELLFLVYITYGEYTQYSAVAEKLLTPMKKRELAEKLSKKGVITESRFRELVGIS